MYSIGSLFSGIGGLELGLEVAGVGQTVWQVEQDEYCQGILAKHWPEAERHHDIRAVGINNLKRVDLICGGFPCQDISLAGSGTGLAGERSGLWWEMFRVIRELRPRYVVVENVPALTSRGLGTVLGNLASIGYDAQWDCISAASIGACHHRDRLFIIAWRNAADTDSLHIREQSGRSGGPSRASQVQPPNHGETRDASDTHGIGLKNSRSREPENGDGVKRENADASDTDSTREQQSAGVFAKGGRRTSDSGETRNASKPLRKGPPLREGLGRPWAYSSIAGSHGGAPEPGVCPVLHDGFSGRVAQLKALGNAVVPAVAYQVGRALLRIDEELTTTGRAVYK